MVAPVVKQSWVVLASLLCNFGIGCIMSFPAALVPALAAPESPIKMDRGTASWFASSMAVGMVFGLITASYLLKKLGRKTAHFLSIIPASFCATVVLFVVLKVSLILFTHITVFGTFAVIALLLLLSLICLYFSLPETRNRTMQEIEDFFVCGKFIERQLNVDDPETQAMVGDKSDTTVY